MTQTNQIGKCSVYYHSSEDMHELADESIQFAMTSVDHFGPLLSICREIHRVLKTDGVFLLNMGHIPRGSTTWDSLARSENMGWMPLVPYEIALRILQTADFRLEEDMLIFRNFGMKPRRIIINYEHLFMFTKSEQWKFVTEKNGLFAGLGHYLEEEDLPKEPPRTFDENELESLLTAFTEKGDTVLDPCAGTGTLGKVATLMSRNAVLYEIDPKREPEIRKNLGSALA